MKKKKVSKFSDWLNESKQKVNEENLEIQCDWWDECIVEVMQDLKDTCNGFLSMGTLTGFVKTKFEILGRDWDEMSDNLIILHIKDLIFQYHGKFFCDSCASDNASLHAKGVVVEQLADVIYNKVVEAEGAMLNFDDKPTVRLADKEPTVMVPMKPLPVYDEDEDFCDELPFEEKRVKKYADYLKEAVATKIKPEDSNECLSYCLNRIKREVGSLDPDAVLDAAVKYASGRAKTRVVAEYIRPMVQDCLDNKSVVICNLDETDDEGMQQVIIGDALDALIDNVVDDVLLTLYKVNGGKDEKA